MNLPDLCSPVRFLQNAIDLDQLAMEAQLSGGDTDAFFTAAKKIYEEGGNSKSYAVLKLTNVPMVRPREGDEVIGKNSAGVETKGKVLKDLPINLTSLQVQYQISEIQESWSSCRVGGLPTDDTWLSGCKLSWEDVGVSFALTILYRFLTIGTYSCYKRK